MAKRKPKKKEESFDILFEPEITDEFPIVIVKWHDSFIEADWKLIEDDKEIDPATITTVGFLIHDGDDHIMVAGSLYCDQTTNRMYIPKACIVEKQIISVE